MSPERDVRARAALMELGGILRSQGRLDEALVQYRELFRSDPEDRIALELLVWVGLEAGRADFVVNTLEGLKSHSYHELAEELEARLSAEPTSENLRFSRFYLLYRSNRVREAMRGFESLLPSARWGAISWNLLGLCYAHESLAQFGEASKCYRKALLLRDDNLDQRCVYFNLACAQYQDYRFEATLQTLKALSGLDPDYPEVKDWLEEVGQLVNSGAKRPGEEGCGGAGSPARVPPAPSPRTGVGRKAWSGHSCL